MDTNDLFSKYIFEKKWQKAHNPTHNFRRTRSSCIAASFKSISWKLSFERDGSVCRFRPQSHLNNLLAHKTLGRRIMVFTPVCAVGASRKAH
jgi:hypothetical protein